MNKARHKNVFKKIESRVKQFVITAPLGSAVVDPAYFQPPRTHHLQDHTHTITAIQVHKTHFLPSAWPIMDTTCLFASKRSRRSNIGDLFKFKGDEVSSISQKLEPLEVRKEKNQVRIHACIFLLWFLQMCGIFSSDQL